MKRLKLFTAVILLAVIWACNAYAGDVDDVEAMVDETINNFNKKNKKLYEAALADDMQSFSGTAKTLLFEDKNSWMNWINGLWSLPFVNYQQQHNSIRVYNGSSAVVNGYYTFTVGTKDGSTTTISGRATINLVKMDGNWMIVNYHFSNFF